jgi:hypothetical protein
MPTPVSHLPDDGTGLARRLRDLESRAQRMEAARRLQQTGVTTGYIAGAPALELTTADQGQGHISLQLRATTPNGLTPSSVVVTFQDGTTLTLAPGTGIAVDTWTALSLQNGWTAAGGSWRAPVARRQSDGTVQCAGEIVPGTLTVGTLLFTLPKPPPGDLTFRLPGGSSSTAADVTVAASGAVTLQNVAGVPTRLGLTGIRYPL